MIVVIVEPPVSPTAEDRAKMPALERCDRFIQPFVIVDEAVMQRLRSVRTQIPDHVIRVRGPLDIDSPRRAGDFEPAVAQIPAIDVGGFHDYVDMRMPALLGGVEFQFDEGDAAGHGDFPASIASQRSETADELVEQTGQRLIVVAQGQREKRDVLAIDAVA